MKAKKKGRRRSSQWFVDWFARKLSVVLQAHEHLAGLDHCLVLIVAGTGKNRRHEMVAPGIWSEDEIAEMMVGFVSDIDNWGKGTFPHAANIHELVQAFMGWVAGQIATYPGAVKIAILATHPEGAVTISYGSPEMKSALIDVLADYEREHAQKAG